MGFGQALREYQIPLSDKLLVNPINWIWIRQSIIDSVHSPALDAVTIWPQTQENEERGIK